MPVADTRVARIQLPVDKITSDGIIAETDNIYILLSGSKCLPSGAARTKKAGQRAKPETTLTKKCKNLGRKSLFKIFKFAQSFFSNTGNVVQ